jgi:hypothetical protein
MITRFSRGNLDGSLQIGIRADSRGFTGACGRSCAGMVCMAGVGPE